MRSALLLSMQILYLLIFCQSSQANILRFQQEFDVNDKFGQEVENGNQFSKSLKSPLELTKSDQAILGQTYIQNCLSWLLMASMRSSSSYLVVAILFTQVKVSLGETLELENGSTYSGEVREGKPHGNGTLTDSYGSNYTGTFVDGLKSGDFVVVFINENRYKGEYRDNERNGKGVYFFADGSKYEGEWKDGKKHGKGVHTWGKGTQWSGDRYEGEYRDDKKHGKGVYYYAGGNKYEGEFKDDKKNGWGNFTYQSKQFYDGELIDDDFNGYGKMIYVDGSVYNGFWNTDEREGEGLLFWPNGTIFFGRMRNDEMFQGILLSPERDVIFAPFKNGLANGNGYKVSNSTGQMSCLSFDQGLENERLCHADQVSSIYHDNFDFYEGEVLEQRGRQLMHGFGEFTGDDGNYMIGNWKEDIQNGFGLQRIPWEPTLIGNFKNGILEGAGVSISTTYPNGVMTIGEWEKGFMEGPGLFSYANGDLVLGYFVKGRLDHDKNPIYIHSNGDISDTWFNVL